MSGVQAMAAFETTVVAVQRISPSVKRITLTSPDLAHLQDGGAGGPRDLRVKVLIPSAGATLPDLSVLDDGWYLRWLAIDPARRGHMRTYTLRSSRSNGSRPEVDIDFVLHGEGEHSGPAGGWARDADVGDVLTVIGQDRRSGLPCNGIEWRPPSAPHPRVLLAGDETAAPAICSILESLPPDAVGHAVVEVPDALDFQQVRCPAGVDVVWLARHDRPRGVPLIAAVDAAMGGSGGSGGRTVDQLQRNGSTVAVRADADPDELLWDTPDEPAAGDLYAWVAGEATVVRTLRRHLVGACGLDRSQVAFMGYWREGRADAG